MRKSIVTAFILTLAALTLVPNRSEAADIFVRGARGSNFSAEQLDQITDMVKRAVRRMPEHMLVQSERMADFVLEPALIERSGALSLRVEKYRDQDFLGVSEKLIRTVSGANLQAYDATEQALLDDRIVGDDDQSFAGDAAWAQDFNFDDQSSESEASLSGMTSSVSTPTSEIRSRIFGPEDIGYFSFGAGPSYGKGLGPGNAMYDISLSYSSPINDFVAGKGLADLNLATNNDPSRFIDLGIGLELFPWRQLVPKTSATGTAPYATGDVGYAFARDYLERTQDALSVGVGAGLRTQAANLNFDVNLHYTVLTEKLQETNPSVFGLRAALNY